MIAENHLTVRIAALPPLFADCMLQQQKNKPSWQPTAKSETSLFAQQPCDNGYIFWRTNATL
jgi:hypothetical protein